MTDAIGATEVNDEEHTRITIGVNCDSAEFFQAEAQQYDIDGPKNLMDGPAMAEWYAKLCKENPLLTYLEDPFQEPVGYKSIQEKLSAAEVEQTVDIGLKSFIHGSLDEL